MVLNFSTVSNWSSAFHPCVKMVLPVKWWMKNADMANGFSNIIKKKKFDVACQLYKNKIKNLN
jgi:hypothetical protein